MTSQQNIRLLPTQAGWAPTCGDATTALGNYLVAEHELPNDESFRSLVDDSIRLIKHCAPFRGPDCVTTGLVVGYVQSGKTMSMTAVASLARDNGCRLVVLLAGTTSNLLQQTARDRLRPYLQGKPDPRRSWYLIDTVDTTELESFVPQMLEFVEDWRNPAVPEDRKRPVFLTVMKNHAHLQQLSRLLRHLPLNGTPCLILDDEADQAGLDTNASKRMAGTKGVAASTTHQRIREIRQALPHHTYLQYTATPQAPLLVALADILSPDFAHVLNPGDGYTGGKAFFEERPQLVVEIPAGDLFSPSSPPTAPPPSLIRAMEDFIVGAADAAVKRADGVRSMLVHPSQRKSDHDAFVRFVDAVRGLWREQLQLPPSDPSHRTLIEDFRVAHARLAETAGDSLLAVDQLIEELPWAIRDVKTWRVNSEDGREVDWSLGSAHILVGGDKLNRGYTVKGLTVTYMPRTPGGWNADTIQQRARFFGYKRSYLDLCRLYLHPDVADAYREYVTHEEDLRGQLRQHEGRPLGDWKRTFLLEHRLRPTRSSVLTETILKPKHKEWFRQSYPHAVPDLIATNRALVDTLVASLELAPHPKASRHQVATLPLRILVNNFILDYRCFGPDAVTWTGLRVWVADLLASSPDANCMIVYIQGGRPRERAEDGGYISRINQLFEGSKGGDKTLRDPSVATLQLHRLDIKGTSHRDVPAIALHMPDGFVARDVQTQIRTV